MGKNFIYVVVYNLCHVECWFFKLIMSCLDIILYKIPCWYICNLCTCTFFKYWKQGSACLLRLKILDVVLRWKVCFLILEAWFLIANCISLIGFAHEKQILLTICRWFCEPYLMILYHDLFFHHHDITKCLPSNLVYYDSWFKVEKAPKRVFIPICHSWFLVLVLDPPLLLKPVYDWYSVVFVQNVPPSLVNRMWTFWYDSWLLISP